MPNTRTIDWLRYGSGHVHGVMVDGKPLVDFERDRLHREVKRAHRSFTQTREYDRVGRLAQMSVRHARSANVLDVLARRTYRYSAAGHLTRIEDDTRGATDYTYDPLGRLLKSVTPDLTELFAFDPAGNPVDAEKVPPRPVIESAEEQVARHARESAEDEAWTRSHPGELPPLRWNQRGSEDSARLRAWKASLPKCIGNVLKELNHTHYAYDERGNLSRKTGPNGVTWIYAYDQQNRLKQAKRYAKPPAADEIDRREKTPAGGIRSIPGTAPVDLVASFDYDAFGRRTSKEVKRASGATELTVFTWDGDVLLMEERFEALPCEHEGERRSENARYETVRENGQDEYSLPVAQRMHTLDSDYRWMRASLYLHEPGTFVPLARLDERLIEPAFLATGTDGGFVQVPAKSRHATVFYQNDHLGTPQELLDESGKVVWLARYKAWGARKRAPYGKIDAVETDNAIRFQGQYADDETGLHYNRHRYYDPSTGRFISKDPIGLAGGLNAFQYAPNPVQWIDPLGLSGKTPPTISAADITNKTRTEIRGLARQKGLEVAKQDAAGLPIKWKCPCTGKERLRLDRGHIDQTTGLPYNDPKAAVDHVHAYDSTGKVKVKSPVDGNPHFPTTGE
nr:RHS repeat-associated core domain-containing protein [Caballeronia sp. ATUFL_M2_KS44]